MNIGELLNEHLIKMQLNGKDKFQVIEELLDLLVQEGKVKDREQALQDLIEREQYLSTGLEHGLAVPHAKTVAVNELLMAFGISKEGIDFDTLDGQPAHFIFLVLSPRDTSGPHIKALAQITRNFRDPDIRRKLMEAQTPQDVLNIFRSFN